MKNLLLLIFFLLSFSAKAKIPAFDSLFVELKTDSLHVCSSQPWQDGDSLILAGKTFSALVKIALDKTQNYWAYLLRDDNREIFVFVYSKKKEDFILNVKLASYVYLEGTMEQKRNAWIMDLNNDGIKDIAICENLLDFELPNEYADNISGTEQFCFLLKNGVFEYHKWQPEFSVSLKK